MKLVQVIINADDLGATREVNEAIFDLIAQGKVTSATIIANAPIVEAASQRIGDYKSCSFGVHLNITEFYPLSDSSGLHQILNDAGEFAGYDRVRRVAKNRELANRIYSEFCAQIDRLMSLGIAISHLDSHHHVHTIPWIFPILKKVQKRFGIRRVRISKNLYGPRETVARQLLVKKRSTIFP